MEHKNKSDEPKQDENQTKEDKKIGETKEELAEETFEKTPKEEKKKKKEKTEAKKEDTKKRIDRGPDFKYIVRISNTDLNGEKNVIYGLSIIRGLGVHMATLVAEQAGVDGKILIGDLNDSQIQKLQETINNLSKTAPIWMLNHRRDYETGQNLHFVSTDIDVRLRDEINIMKKIKSYRGVRHELGLPVRGQRTRTHGRVGLALGVSRKTVKQAASSSEKSNE